MKILDEDGQYKLLECRSINDRTLVAYYNEDDKTYNLALFHLTDPCNYIGRKAPYSTWGYCTYFVGDIANATQASEVVGLYLRDIENDNFWWENIDDNMDNGDKDT